MRFKCSWIVVCVLSVVAWGQNQAQSSVPTQSSIHGIKILSSTFDASKSLEAVQLEFINDSPANITAWGYCVRTEKVKSEDQDQGFCTLVDPLPVAVDRDVQERITRQASPADCPACHFIHPGERKVLSAAFAVPVRSAQIQINLIAYSNGSAEISGQEGSSNLEQLSGGRQNLLRLTQRVLSMAKDILADPTNQHPTDRMITELQAQVSNEPGLRGYLRNLKKPEWRKGNSKEFIPDDERGYLRKFVFEKEMEAAELSKFQVQGVAQ